MCEPVFLDLFAGTQSCRETAIAAGLTYIPLDILERVYCKRTDSYVSNIVCDMEKDGNPAHIESLIETAIGGSSNYEIVALWSSPVCTTYSWLNTTNMSKGGSYRDYKCPDASALTADAKKYQTCISHDKLVTNTLELIKHFRKRFPSLLYAIENPKNLLPRRPYMREFIADETNCCTPVQRDHCVFGHHYRKRTMYFTNSTSLIACTGSNKTGRCDSGITCTARVFIENGVRRHAHEYAIGSRETKRLKLTKAKNKSINIAAVPKALIDAFLAQYVLLKGAQQPQA